jgi:hypothetical protein
VPVDDRPLREGPLRSVATRDNQRLRIRLADDHTLDAWVQGLADAA